ncbi:MAG: hypothetical protein P4L73_19260 [Caulobacteraceae bacterium]|nr:hypothetical protein [Caulobacteraceae bacterium]
MWVKNAEGLRVRDYRTYQLWPDGEPQQLPDGDLVIAQLMAFGDVVACDPPAPPAPAPAKAAAASSAPASAPASSEPVVDPKGADQ